MKKRLLLLIEDNPLLTGMYQTALEAAGFHVLLAHDGEEGLVAARSEKPEGIVLDLLMPGMDGYAVLAQLKKDKETKSIKTIVLTSVTESEDLERAKKLGAVDCLIKSDLTLANIVERIKGHFL